MILSIINLFFLDIIKIDLFNAGLAKKSSTKMKILSRAIDRFKFLRNVSDRLPDKGLERPYQSLPVDRL